jgi:hypothetical protein
MLADLVLRFVIGGLIVSAFAVLGDILRPKSFAGIFGAAPSVALASLGLAFITRGSAHAAVEGRSMVVGALALGCYSLLVARLLLHYQWNPIVATGLSWLLWLAVAFGLWAAFLR